MSDVLDIKNLTVHIPTDSGNVEAVRDVSLTLQEGETLAIVGESGCGKSILCKSIMKLLPQSARITGGSIKVCGRDITTYSDREMCRLRGELFSMIFQDPMTTLDPTMTIGSQIAKVVRIHNPKMKREAVYSRVNELKAVSYTQQTLTTNSLV